MDSASNLYIVDTAFNTVRVVDAATGIISAVAGIPGQAGHAGDGGPALRAQLTYPSSVALDHQGNLYIGDGDYLRKVNLQSGLISTLAGGAILSQACAPSATQNCAGSALKLTFQASSGLVAGTDRLYASINTPGQGTNGINEVVAVSYQTGEVQLLAGGGSSPDGPVIGSTAANSTFLFPAQIALDSAGNLDIGLDTAVLQLAKGGSTLTTLAGTIDDFGFAGDGGPATSALLSALEGVTLSPNGAIVVTDWTRLRSISAGSITTVAGDGTLHFYGDGGLATQAGLSSPMDTAFDGQGNLYIADAGNNTVRKVDAAAGAITTVWGTPVYDPNFSFRTVVPLLSDITTEDATHLFLFTSQGVLQLDLTTGATTMISPVSSSVGLLAHGQLSFDGKQTLAFENSSELGTIDIPTGSITQISTFSPGLLSGVAIDAGGNIYFSSECAVYLRDILTRSITKIVGDGSCSPSTGGNLSTDTSLLFPGYLHLDGAGHLLIAELDRIDSVDLAAGTITSIGGSGVKGFLGDGGPATSAELSEANSVNGDGAGHFYVADTANDRIRLIAAPLPQLAAVLGASAPSITVGASETLTATFTGLTSGNIPAPGTVTFYDGSTALTSPSVTFTSGGSSFLVMLATSSLSVGTHSITAQFAGDAHYAAVTTAPVVVTVVAPAIPPSFTVTSAPASLTLSQGGSGTAVFTVTPAGGFNSAVTFSCGSGLPAGVSCAFAPASVTPTGTAAVTATLTVTTTAANEAVLVPLVQPDGRWWVPGGVSLACLLLFGVPRRRRGLWLMVLGFALVVGVGLGCGSSSPAAKGPTPNPDATPVGTYTLKLAAAGSGSTEPVSFTLTVTQ